MLARTSFLGVPGTTLEHRKCFKFSPTPALGHSTVLEITGRELARHSTPQQQLLQWAPTPNASYYGATAQQNTQLYTLFKAHLEKDICVTTSPSNLLSDTTS